MNWKKLGSFFALAYLFVILTGCGLATLTPKGEEAAQKVTDEIFNEALESATGAINPDKADQIEATRSAPAIHTRAAKPTLTPKFKGVDILGLAMQDVGMICGTIPPNTALGFLQYTFGDAFPAARQCLKTGKVSAFRVHCSNGPCARNRNCDTEEPKANDLKSLTKCAVNAQSLYNDFGKPCYISPRVEHDEKDKKLVNQWFSVIKANAPNCIPVISAFTGYAPPGIMAEKHGNSAYGAIISNDGQSIFDANSDQYSQSASEIQFNWTNRDNLRVSGEKTFTKPKKRSKSKRLTKLELIQKIRLLNKSAAKPADPKFCKTIKDVPSNEIHKPNAEDYDNGDVRGGRPLLISRMNADRFDILDPSGKKIGCFKKYGPFDGGGSRFYEGSCSGLHAVELMDKAKSEWVFARSGNTCYRINIIRRGGNYRK